MGLSASQGRMLLLTARKSDLEFRAQQISQKRLILSQQLEEISQDYEDATSNRQMKINLFGQDGDDDNYGGKARNLTYAALVSGTVNSKLGNDVTGIQAGKNTKYHTDLTSNKFFRLVNADGAIVVSDVDEIPGSYKIEQAPVTQKISAKKSDNADLNAILSKRTGISSGTYKNADGSKQDVIQVKYNGENGNKLIAYIDANTGKLISQGKTIEEGKEDSNYTKGATASSNDKLEYSYSTEVLGTGDDITLNITKKSTETETLGEPVEGADGKYQIQVNGNWYTYIVDPAVAMGTSDAAGDKTGPNYLQDCLRNGKYLIEQGNKDTEEGQYLWKSVSWDAISNINDSYYTEDDDKAKAKYDRLQTQIQNQDKKLELELDNIETQRSAVTTEVESVQKVIDDNVQDSFKVFNA